MDEASVRISVDTSDPKTVKHQFNNRQTILKKIDYIYLVKSVD
jgi:hypothetical protein